MGVMSIGTTFKAVTLSPPPRESRQTRAPGTLTLEVTDMEIRRETRKERPVRRRNTKRVGAPAK